MKKMTPKPHREKKRRPRPQPRLHVTLCLEDVDPELEAASRAALGLFASRVALSHPQIAAEAYFVLAGLRENNSARKSHANA